MRIKSIVAGIIIAMAMIAVGPSQAAHATCKKCVTCPTCEAWTVPAQFSGTGWHMVPCNSYFKHATTWQEYSSGRFAPPETRSGLILGL